MQISENVSLKDYSTMRLGGNARFLTQITSKDELKEALSFAQEKKLNTIMIGYGSNIVWNDKGFDGLVIVNRIMGVSEQPIDETKSLWTFAAGEVWDEVVEKTVAAGFSGIEFLSLIPGTVGGTPVQNVGAYGREIKEVLVSVEAYDAQIQDFVTIKNEDCGFAYRTSRFKTTDKDRFFITSIGLALAKENPKPPFYDSLTKYFADHNITVFTPQAVREAVIAVRTQKLPDPDVVANNGSFFANPILPAADFEKLHAQYPEIVNWPQSSGSVKVSAGWLVEQAGFKDYHDIETGMATWDEQSLVLINEHANSTADLLKFKAKIISAVQEKFGITLEQEPELI